MNEENNAAPVAPIPATPSSSAPAPEAPVAPTPATPAAGPAAEAKSGEKGNFAKDILAAIASKLPDKMFPPSIKLQGDIAWQAALGALVLDEILWLVCTSKFVAILMALAAVATVYLALLAAKRLPEKPKDYVYYVIWICLAFGVINFFTSFSLMSAAADLAEAENAVRNMRF